MVEITEGSSTEQGVLLIDIRYDSLEQLFDEITLGNGGYVYLIGTDGELIYHPESQLCIPGWKRGKTSRRRPATATGSRSVPGEKAGGDYPKTVGYTGWKIIRAAPTGESP